MYHVGKIVANVSLWIMFENKPGDDVRACKHYQESPVKDEDNIRSFNKRLSLSLFLCKIIENFDRFFNF